MIYRNRCERANHYTTDAVSLNTEDNSFCASPPFQLEIKILEQHPFYAVLFYFIKPLFHVVLDSDKIIKGKWKTPLEKKMSQNQDNMGKGLTGLINIKNLA